MSTPSWDIRYLEEVERRLRVLEERVQALESMKASETKPRKR